MKGFFQLQRRFFDHHLWTEEREFSRAEAFLDLLQLAAFTHTRRIVKGGVIELQPGQLCGSIRYLSVRWKWSIKRVRTYLDLLEAERMVAREKAQQGTVITLVNYRKYASGESMQGTAKAHQGHTEGTPRAHSYIIEEGKEREEGERAKSAPAPAQLISPPVRQPRPTPPPAPAVEQEEPRRPQPLDVIREKVNGLRTEWGRMPHMTGAELHALYAAAQALESLPDEDWDTMRDYLAAKLPEGSGAWQPRSRVKFMENPSDVLTLALQWRSKMPKRFAPTPPRPVQEVTELTPDQKREADEALAEMMAMFKAGRNKTDTTQQ